ncbi:MAG: hypothetical protein GWO24_00820, partial [Akkermansiaceae bacterium]|nr:hypothetical protein [Akkermansiaceae bacterium]
MSGLAILVSTAAAAFAVSHWLRLPVIPLLILLGFVLSRCGITIESDTLNNLMGLG